MGISIFQLDWIFIDTVIITLLIVLLVIVKLYKITARWRGSFSNEAIAYTSYKKSDLKLNTLNLFPKNWKLIRNKAIENESSRNPVIVIIRTNHKKKLLHILTEGFVSYGFNILNIKLNIKPCPNCDPLEKSVQDETKYVISAILNYLKNKDMISNSNYIVINYSKSILSYNSLLSDSKNKGFIIINPKINNINLRNISEFLNASNLKSSLHLLFSKKTLLLLNNKNLEIFLKNYSKTDKEKLRFFIFDKARISFKYYETILLSKIIDLIETNLLQSHN
jgi:hypothetical protein